MKRFIYSISVFLLSAVASLADIGYDNFKTEDGRLSYSNGTLTVEKIIANGSELTDIPHNSENIFTQSWAVLYSDGTTNQHGVGLGVDGGILTSRGESSPEMSRNALLDTVTATRISGTFVDAALLTPSAISMGGNTVDSFIDMVPTFSVLGGGPQRFSPVYSSRSASLNPYLQMKSVAPGAGVWIEDKGTYLEFSLLSASNAYDVAHYFSATNAIWYANSYGVITPLALGTSNYVLTSQGSGLPPKWSVGAAASDSVLLNGQPAAYYLDFLHVTNLLATLDGETLNYTKFNAIAPDTNTALRFETVAGRTTLRISAYGSGTNSFNPTADYTWSGINDYYKTVRMQHPPQSFGVGAYPGAGRATNALDLQFYRTDNARVASGAHSANVGGINGASSGAYSFKAGGDSIISGGSYSFAGGGRLNDNYGPYAGTLSGFDNYISSDGYYSWVLGGLGVDVYANNAGAAGRYCTVGTWKHRTFLFGFGASDTQRCVAVTNDSVQFGDTNYPLSVYFSALPKYWNGSAWADVGTGSGTGTGTVDYAIVTNVAVNVLAASLADTNAASAASKQDVLDSAGTSGSTITNIGFGLIGTGDETPLAIDTSLIATGTPLYAYTETDPVWGEWMASTNENGYSNSVAALVEGVAVTNASVLSYGVSNLVHEAVALNTNDFGWDGSTLTVTAATGGGGSSTKTIGGRATDWAWSGSLYAAPRTTNGVTYLEFPLDTTNLVNGVQLVGIDGVAVTQLIIRATASTGGGTIGLLSGFGTALTTNEITIPRFTTNSIQAVDVSHTLTGMTNGLFRWGVLPTNAVGTASGVAWVEIFQLRYK